MPSSQDAIDSAIFYCGVPIKWDATTVDCSPTSTPYCNPFLLEEPTRHEHTPSVTTAETNGINMHTILTNEARDTFVATAWSSAGRIPAGFYNYDSGMLGMEFGVMPIGKERFEKPVGGQRLAVEAVEAFWGARERYKMLGVPHRTGILLSGDPGCGKTAVLRHAMQKTVANGGYCIALGDASELSAALKCLRNQAEVGVRILIVLEDMDSRVGQNDAYWTQLFDGVGAELEGCLTIATTNYKDQLSKRLIRPGRFDTHIHLDNPALDERLTYLATLWGVPETHESVIELANRGMCTMAELRARAVAQFVAGLPGVDAGAKLMASAVA